MPLIKRRLRSDLRRAGKGLKIATKGVVGLGDFGWLIENGGRDEMIDSFKSMARWPILHSQRWCSIMARRAKSRAF